MPRGVDLGIDREDIPIGADDAGDPPRVNRVLGVASAVGEPDAPCGVAEKGEIEAELLRERAVLVLGIEADSQNLYVLLLELPNVVAEPATFGGSAGGVGLGIEPEDYDLSEVVLQPNEISEMIPDLELGGFLSFLEHGRFSRSPNETRRRL
jgi:hypothetical protein